MTSTSLLRRLDRLRQALAADQLALITRPADITYLTGGTFLVPDEREAVLVVTPRLTQLWVAHFSPPPRLRGLDSKIGCRPQDIERHLSILLAEGLDGQGALGDQVPAEVLIDQSTLRVDELRAIERVITKAGDAVRTAEASQADRPVRLVPHPPDFISRWRLIKDEDEINLMAEAGKVTARAVSLIRRQLKVGQTEFEVKRQLNRLLEDLGGNQANGPAFPTIVAFGAHAALPHHQPDDTALTTHTAVLIDCGLDLNGYKADISRSWWFGDQRRQPAEYRQARRAVNQAYQAALSALKPPLPRAKAVDAAARDVIAAAGFREAFIHTTGHGLGLEIHEPPSLGGRPDVQLKPGMVVTIEPGVYLEGKFGIRHENTVVVTENVPRVLTEAEGKIK